MNGSLPFNYSTEENPKQPVPDSSAASGTDRGVSNSVAEVPSPAGPSSDPYKRVLDFFSTVAEDEPEWQKDLRDNMMEMFRDTFTDNMGAAVPQTEYKPLGIGYGPLGMQQFPEACAFELMLGPQGEPVYEPREPRFNENHDEKGQFTSGSSSVLTKAGAQNLLDKMNVPGLKIVGSVAHKGSSTHDVDLLADSKESAAEAKEKLEAHGFEWMGSGAVSPKEVARYGEGKTYGDKSLWSVNDKYEHKETGEKLEVWHKEKGEDSRALRFNENHDEKGQFASGSSELYEKTFGKVGDVKTADEVVSSVGNKQAADVLKSRGGMDATFTLKEIPVGSVRPSNGVEKGRLKEFTAKTTEAPPIVAYEGEVIDGNGRLAAAKMRGETTIKAYVGYKNEESERSLRFNDNHDDKGQFASGAGGTYTYPVSVNDKSFVHQQVFDSKMDEALKSGSVESYAAFKAASDSMSGNMASMSLSEIAKNDAVASLKEHLSAATEPATKDAIKAGIASLSKRMNENHDAKGQFASGVGGSPKDQKIGDKVKDVFGNEGTVKGWHGQSGTVQVDVVGKLQYWHPSQFQRWLYVHCGPQGEILEERALPSPSHLTDKREELCLTQK